MRQYTYRTRKNPDGSRTVTRTSESEEFWQRFIGYLVVVSIVIMPAY